MVGSRPGYDEDRRHLDAGHDLLTPKDVAYRIQSAETAAVMTDDDGALKVEQVAHECPTLRLRSCLERSVTGG